MEQIIKAKLREIAKKKSLITYQQLSDQCKLHLDMSNIEQRNQLAKLLGDISTTEFISGRPLISVVVIGQDNNKPGNGFFNLATELGIFNGGNNSQAQDNFFIEELNKCYNYWQNH